MAGVLAGDDQVRGGVQEVLGETVLVGLVQFEPDGGEALPESGDQCGYEPGAQGVQEGQ